MQYFPPWQQRPPSGVFASIELHIMIPAGIVAMAAIPYWPFRQIYRQGRLRP